jgi:hypothetical protein
MVAKFLGREKQSPFFYSVGEVFFCAKQKQPSVVPSFFKRAIRLLVAQANFRALTLRPALFILNSIIDPTPAIKAAPDSMIDGHLSPKMAVAIAANWMATFHLPQACDLKSSSSNGAFRIQPIRNPKACAKSMMTSEPTTAPKAM